MYTVYSKPNCPFCDQAKKLLASCGLAYEEIILDVGQPKLAEKTYISRDDLINLIPMARTVPQIILSTDTTSIVIGGYDDLKRRLQLAA